MKICLFITGLGMGGAENQVCSLADEFSNNGHDVMLVSMNYETTVRPKCPNVNLVELKIKKKPISLIRGFYKSIKLVNKFKPDVIHSHMFHANLFCRVLNVFTKCKLVNTAHNANEGGGWRNKAYGMTASLCNTMTNVCQEAVDEFIIKGCAKPDSIQVVYNGINTERFSPTNKTNNSKRELGLHDSCKLFVAVGRLEPVKDYPTMLRAFKNVVYLNSNIHLAIIGSSYELDNLKKLTKDLNLENYVTFVGRRYDVENWLADADVFVLSSIYEGFPLVVGEAMSSGTVVISTDCGGVREFLGECEFLSEPKDINQLSDNMLKSISLTDQQKETIETKNRNRIISNYSLQSVCSKWSSIYKEC